MSQRKDGTRQWKSRLSTFQTPIQGNGSEHPRANAIKAFAHELYEIESDAESGFGIQASPMYRAVRAEHRQIRKERIRKDVRYQAP